MIVPDADYWHAIRDEQQRALDSVRNVLALLGPSASGHTIGYWRKRERALTVLRDFAAWQADQIANATKLSRG